MRLDNRLDMTRVTAPRSLVMGEHDPLFAGDHCCDQIGPRLGRDLGQKPGGDEMRHERLDDEAAPEFLEDQRILDRSAAVAAGVFRNTGAKPAQFGEGLPMAFEHALARADDRPAFVEVIFALAKAADAVDQRLLFCGESEIHRCRRHRPRMVLAMMVRWISLAPP